MHVTVSSVQILGLSQPLLQLPYAVPQQQSQYYRLGNNFYFFVTFINLHLTSQIF
jgi:hypothetical protein